MPILSTRSIPELVIERWLDYKFKIANVAFCLWGSSSCLVIKMVRQKYVELQQSES